MILELIRLGIRAEPESIAIVQGIIRYYARMYGLQQDDVERFLVTVEESLSQVIEFGFPGSPDSMFDVTLGIDGLDLTVTIEDKGIPYDYDVLENMHDAGISVRLMRGFADRVILSSMGSKGRVQVLTKHLATLPKYVRRDEQPLLHACNLSPEDIDFHMLRREEAIEVAQCMYDEFGYTYAHEIVYYPEKFFEAVERGECISLVATAPDGEVAGHVALVGSHSLPGTMELCMGVVKKKFRNCSIMSRMTSMVLEQGRNMGLSSIHAMPVIYHVFTQKVCNKQDMHPSGFLFNYLNEDLATSYDQGFRASLGLATMILRDTDRDVFIRPSAEGIVRFIVSESGIDRRIINDSAPEFNGDSEVTVDVDPRIESGRIMVHNSGRDIGTVLKGMDMYMREQKCKVAQIYINTGESGALSAYDAAVSLGYYCTGFFTGCSDHDYLMMESVMYSAVDYGKIETIEPYTGLLELVREADPHA